MESIKHCPFCGEEILSTAKKCKHCGEWLPEQNEKKKDEQSGNSLFCPICAEPINKGTKVCPYCHEVLVEEEIQVVQSAPVTQNISISDLENTASNVQDDNSRSFFAYYFVDVFFKHYADFKGSINRKQFWMGYLCYAILMFVLMCIDFIVDSPFFITALASVVLIIPGIAFVVRRLHDINKSGWYFLISCIPLIGFIWLLVLLCKKGKTPVEIVKNKTNDWKIWLSIIVLVGLAIGKYATSCTQEKTISLPADVVEKANSPVIDPTNTEDDSFMEETMGSGNFHGYIAGKYECTFTLSFNETDEDGILVVSGIYYYNNKGPENSIIVEGSYSLADGELNLTEYYEDGTPNCTISAIKVPQGFRGTFTTPDGKEMDFFIAPLE